MFRDDGPMGSHDDPEFALHPTVRSFVHAGYHRGSGQGWPKFAQAGYTSGGPRWIRRRGGRRGTEARLRRARGVRDAPRSRMPTFGALLLQPILFRSCARDGGEHGVTLDRTFRIRQAGDARRDRERSAEQRWTLSYRQSLWSSVRIGALRGRAPWLYNHLGTCAVRRGHMPTRMRVPMAGRAQPCDRADPLRRQRVLRSHPASAHVSRRGVGCVRPLSRFNDCRRTNYHLQ